MNQFPKKEQAIVLAANDELKLTDYVLAVGELVQPNKNVIFASRMSNSRICIYLSDESLVDKIVSKNTTIKINDVEVNLRRLINPAKRIILSNVVTFNSP